MPRGTFQCSRPYGGLLSTRASTGGPPTVAGSFGSVSCKVSAPLLWVSAHTKFCLYFPRLESLFPSVLWKAYGQIPQAQIPWGLPVPLSDPQARNLDVGFRTFTTVWELLWYYYSPVCGSPIQLVWDLIWSWLHPPTILLWLLLCLWMGVSFFSGFQSPSVSGCSTASCNFAALNRRRWAHILLLHNLEPETSIIDFRKSGERRLRKMKASFIYERKKERLFGISF